MNYKVTAVSENGLFVVYDGPSLRSANTTFDTAEHVIQLSHGSATLMIRGGGKLTRSHKFVDGFEDTKARYIAPLDGAYESVIEMERRTRNT